jgi:RNA polymerase sigma-70 factor (ECF subfamily)
LFNDQEYNESVLLRQLAEGNEEAFRKLFLAYKDKLYTYICKLSGSAETAEDMVHDVFLKLWEKREALPDIDNLNAYLYQISRNKSINLFRRMAKETLILSEIGRDEGIPGSLEGENRLIHADVLASIREAVDKLTPQQRQVFLLSRQNGLKINEIARKLGITERTVTNHMSQALRFLREELSRQYGPSAVIIYALYNLSTN